MAQRQFRRIAVKLLRLVRDPSWRLLALYAGGAWAVSEASETMVKRFHLSDRVYVVTILIAALGIPVVLLAQLFLRATLPNQRRKLALRGTKTTHRDKQATVSVFLGTSLASIALVLLCGWGAIQLHAFSNSNPRINSSKNLTVLNPVINSPKDLSVVYLVDHSLSFEGLFAQSARKIEPLIESTMRSKHWAHQRHRIAALSDGTDALRFICDYSAASSSLGLEVAMCLKMLQSEPSKMGTDISASVEFAAASMRVLRTGTGTRVIVILSDLLDEPVTRAKHRLGDLSNVCVAIVGGATSARELYSVQDRTDSLASRFRNAHAKLVNSWILDAFSEEELQYFFAACADNSKGASK